jgi:hypothetical protein
MEFQNATKLLNNSESIGVFVEERLFYNEYNYEKVLLGLFFTALSLW